MEKKSPHILSTASNLLGFSFLVLSSIKGFNLPQKGFIDEALGLTIFILAFSCLFSFVSMRSHNVNNTERSEIIAEYLFLSALLVLVVLSLLLALNSIYFV